ncbi:hypothetical protein RND81_01G031200 [Saponaria officinalis]|uniref:AT-hook motif nuclear-localized protein n=1 Tax=Saponaria officinalis TaxID=3572 RepID=A0AAW1NCB4_SAPOF
MEEKESIMSGSPENTESGSPNPISFAGGSGGVMSAPPSEPPLTGAAGGGEGVKKKRGRPRKFDEFGNLSPAYTANAARKAAAKTTLSPPPEFSLTTATTAAVVNTNSTTSFEFSGPKKQQFGTSSMSEIFAETAGVDFTPHVITVHKGEDVAAKIHALANKAPRGICVLSANGTITNVTIRQPGSSGSLLTYEGRFEILSLSGSYTVSEANGITSKTGGLSISLAGPDGRVVGGGVAGWIIAANPIQVVVGSFVPNGYKTQKRKYNRESHTPSTMSGFPNTTPAEIPNSQAMHHYHEAGPPVVSPVPAHSHSEADDSMGSGHNLNVVSSHDTQEWNSGSEPHRLYPDINVCVTGL